jgi:hypothetical protein
MGASRFIEAVQMKELAMLGSGGPRPGSEVIASSMGVLPKSKQVEAGKP